MVLAFYGWLPFNLTNLHSYWKGSSDLLRINYNCLYLFSWSLLPSILVAPVGGRFRMSFGSPYACTCCVLHDIIKSSLAMLHNTVRHFKEIREFHPVFHGCYSLQNKHLHDYDGYVSFSSCNRRSQHGSGNFKEHSAVPFKSYRYALELFYDNTDIHSLHSKPVHADSWRN